MLKGAIIGFGKIARSSHLDAYLNSSLNKRAKIVAAVEPVISNYQNGKNEFPDIKFYSTIDELLDKEEIDFVDITCPPTYHYDVMKKCVDRNIHILCEKPFTLNLQEAESIQNTIKSSGIVFMPCHQYKYSPVWMNFKKFIGEQNGSHRVLAQFNIFRLQADPGLESISAKWRTSSFQQGGGILIDTGIHYLYLANWMLGKPFKVTSNLTTLSHSDYNCEDTATIILESEKGVAQITVTWAADKRHNDARVVCANGSLNYESGNKMLKSTASGNEEIIVPDASEKSHYSSLYVNMFTEFFDAVENKKQNKEWIDEAYQSILLLDQCYKSSELNNLNVKYEQQI